MNRSRRRSNDANTIDKHAKHVDANTMTRTTNKILTTSNVNVTPNTNASKMMTTACNSPRTPADIAFPTTIDPRPVGVTISFAKIPESLSHVIAIP